MKKGLAGIALLLLISLSSCEVVGGIFKAGMGVGILIVVLIVAVIAWLLFKSRKNT